MREYLELILIFTTKGIFLNETIFMVVKKDGNIREIHTCSGKCIETNFTQSLQ